MNLSLSTYHYHLTPYSKSWSPCKNCMQINYSLKYDAVTLQQVKFLSKFYQCFFLKPFPTYCILLWYIDYTKMLNVSCVKCNLYCPSSRQLNHVKLIAVASHKPWLDESICWIAICKAGWDVSNVPWIYGISVQANYGGPCTQHCAGFSQLVS